jgi:two-component system, response regulator YesN
MDLALMTHRRSRLLRRLTLSYLIPLAVPLIVILALSFPVSERLLTADVRARSADVLDSLKTQLDSQMSDLLATIQAIGENPDVRSQLQSTSPFSDYLVQRELVKSASSNGFIDRVLLYSFPKGRIISGSMSFPAEEMGARYFIYDQWDRAVLLLRVRSATTPFYRSAEPVRRNLVETADRMVTFVFPYPFRNSTAAPASLIVLVREEAIQQIIASALEVSGGSFAVVDPDGRIVVSEGVPEIPPKLLGRGVSERDVPTPVLDTSTADTPLYVGHVRSEVMDWTYFNASAPDPLLERLRAVRILSVAALVAFLLVQSVLIYLAARFNYRPIRALVAHVQAIGGEGDHGRPKALGGDELLFIQESFDRLVGNDRVRARSSRVSEHAIRESLLYGLLRGEFDTVAKFNARARALGTGIELSGSYLVVVSVGCRDCPDGLLELNIEDVMTVARAVQPDVYDSTHFIRDLRPGSVVGILSMNQRERRDLPVVLTRLTEELKVRHNIQVVAGAGAIVEGPREIRNSYSTSQYALDAVRLKGAETVLVYDSMESTFDGYAEYPYELLHQLRFVGMNTGDQSLDRVLERIVGVLEDDATSVHTARSVFTETMRTLVTLIASYDSQLSRALLMRATPLIISGSSGVAEMKAHVDRLAGELRRLAAEDVGWRDLLQRSLDFIHANYMDPQFSIELVAAHTGKTVSNFSHFFRSHTGHSFLEFVTTLRMNKAKELLQDDELTIDEIARATRFAGSSSFIKSFKKRVGTSPGRYREQHRSA